MDACPSGWLDPVCRVVRVRAAPFPRQVLKMVPCREPGGPDSTPALPFARATPQVPSCALASAARPTSLSHFPGTWDANRATGSPAARGSLPALWISLWATAHERASWFWGHTCYLERALSPVETEPCFPDFSKLVLVQDDLPDALGREPAGPSRAASRAQRRSPTAWNLRSHSRLTSVHTPQTPEPRAPRRPPERGLRGPAGLCVSPRGPPAHGARVRTQPRPLPAVWPWAGQGPWAQ